MIYVRRDPSLIPEKVLRVAERAQAKLEALAPEKRLEFIEKKCESVEQKSGGHSEA